jgi:hypothetical protein
MTSTLPPPVADQLAGSMVEWLAAMRPKWLRPHALEGCDEIPSRQVSCATRQAIVESRNLLERASAQAGPLARFRSALAAGSSRSTCVPSEEDAARAAVLAHLVEMDTVTSFVRAPGAGCVQAATLAPQGWVTADTSGRPSKRDSLLIETPRSPRASEARRPGETDPDAASTRIVRYGWYEDGQASSGGDLVVKKVDGVWRVVGEMSSWID